MKKNLYFYLIAATALTFSACSSDKDIVEEELDKAAPVVAQEGEPTSFTASIANSMEYLEEEDLDVTTAPGIKPRKVQIGDGFTIAKWFTNDKISISDGTLNYTFNPKADTEGGSCSFETSGNSFITDGTGEDRTFYAFYPQDAVQSWSGPTATAMIWTEQDYTENLEYSTSVEGSGVMGPYMAATATTTDGGSKASFTFGHICSVIDIDLSSFNGGTVESVALCSNTRVSLAGRMSYNASTKAITVSTAEEGTYFSNQQSDVVIVSGINASTPSVVRFYVLPVKQTAGITITVRTTDGNYYTKSSSTAVGTTEANENYLASVSGVTSGTVCLPYYKKYKFNTINNAKTNRWMAMIPGSTYFSMLSTPGSHDSATSGVSTSAAKCQSETIAQQLENGVRAFDLRPGYKYSTTITTENLYIYHGMVNTNVLYKDAIKAMVDFLKDNPTETLSVIMAKEDGTPLLASWTDYTTEMCNAIDAIHTQYTDNIKILDHSYYTLTDYRGKIFFGYRNAWDLYKTVRVTNWADNASVKDYTVGVGGTCTASIEDEYNKTGDSKKTVVNALLDMASANTDHKRFHYTFTSCANSPSSYASVQNPAAATYITETLTGPTGYVYADYMGSSSNSGQTLLKAVIAQNLKYVYKGRTRITSSSSTGTGINTAGDEWADGGTTYVKQR